LPDEIYEISKHREGASTFVSADAPSDGAMGAALEAVPMGVDERLLRQKPPEEQQRILQRREEALVQNKVLRAISRRGLQLRELFAMLDVDGSGELDPDEFIQGIQQLDGQLTEPQCVRLMEQIDTDLSGTVDFNELTRALQKLDLRVEMHDYLLVCLRFFSAEMHRSATILRSRFDQAAKTAAQKGPNGGCKSSKRPNKDSGGGGGAAADSSSSSSSKAEGKEKELAHQISTGGLAGGAPPLPPGELRPDSVRALLKTLDAPFPHAVAQRIIGEMAKAAPADAEGGAGGEPLTSRSRAAALSARVGAGAPESEKTMRITKESFVRVVMTNGFHAVSSPAFKEMAVASAANVAMAVNAFAKKLGAKK